MTFPRIDLLLSPLVGLTVALCLVSVACGTTQPPSREDIPPEEATGLRRLEAVRAKTNMVVAATPLAARAGQEMLEAGGSAMDATVAAALMLTLTEPQSSGIGGGAFLLYHDSGSGNVAAYDGRETAPASARPDMFLKEDGEPRPFWEAVAGGLSVGIPGQLRMLELAHRQHGRLPWARLFEPAIERAEAGFFVSPRLHKLLSLDPFLRTLPAAGALYYTADGRPLPVGTVLKNPALAATFRTVAEGGAAAFYSGPLADRIVAAVSGAPRNPAQLTAADLSGYEAKVRAPVCLRYRRWRVCGFPPPTSGGVTSLQILGLLGHFDLAGKAHDSADFLHLFTEASRLAYADRALYLADPDFVPDVPVRGLLDADYLTTRARSIDPTRSMGKASPGTPPGADTGQWGPDASPQLPSTTHVVVVDAEGNGASMTASIESAFGSHLLVGGFLLNNELTDFSFRPEVDGKPVANRVQPGKRPRSSMSPMLVFEDRQLVLAVGSAGGSRIIEYVTLAIVRVLDFGLDVQTALNQPNVVNRNGKTELERMVGQEAWLERARAALTALGHEVEIRDLNSGLHALQVTPDGLVGAVDPRREGLVVGR